MPEWSRIQAGPLTPPRPPGPRWARRLAGRPELVFLDEPTAGLDPQGRRLVWELVDALRAGGKGSGWTPDNEPAKRVWHYVDPPAMAAAMGVADAKLYYIAVDETPNPGGYPIGGATGGTLPNNHLQYAITWYALAVALVVIYIVFHLKRRV